MKIVHLRCGHDARDEMAARFEGLCPVCFEQYKKDRAAAMAEDAEWKPTDLKPVRLKSRKTGGGGFKGQVYRQRCGMRHTNS